MSKRCPIILFVKCGAFGSALLYSAVNLWYPSQPCFIEYLVIQYTAPVLKQACTKKGTLSLWIILMSIQLFNCVLLKLAELLPVHDKHIIYWLTLTWNNLAKSKCPWKGTLRTFRLSQDGRWQGAARVNEARQIGDIVNQRTEPPLCSKTPATYHLRQCGMPWLDASLTVTLRGTTWRLFGELGIFLGALSLSLSLYFYHLSTINRYWSFNSTSTPVSTNIPVSIITRLFLELCQFIVMDLNNCAITHYRINRNERWLKWVAESD